MQELLVAVCKNTIQSCRPSPWLNSQVPSLDVDCWYKPALAAYFRQHSPPFCYLHGTVFEIHVFKRCPSPKQRFHPCSHLTRIHSCECRTLQNCRFGCYADMDIDPLQHSQCYRCHQRPFLRRGG